MCLGPRREPTHDAPHCHITTFSLVQGGLPYYIQQKLGLIPSRGLGIPRRMLFFILLTWAPIMAWAIVSRRLFPGIATEPLLYHFSVHVRCLVAIPLFITAEAIVEGISQRIFPYFVTSGIVTGALESRFVEILRQAGRLRDSWLAGAVLAALALLLAWYFTGVSEALHEDELSWAVLSETGHPQLGFGGWWFLFVVRPVFTFFLLHWVWRLFITLVLSWRIAHLDLHLVPTHPDRTGGLGFLEQVPFAFSPIILAMSAVIASHWAHQILYHQADVDAFNLPLGVLVVALLVIFLGPSLLFSPPLRQLKRRSLLTYGALASEYGWMVQKRWILGEPVQDNGLLAAPDLRLLANTIKRYDAVKRTKLAPLGKRSLVAVLAPALLPMIPVFAIKVPVKDTLLRLLGVLI
jgi:hypothetical protein